MRWLNCKKEPQYMDKRTVTKFAFVPTKVGKYTVWLERYIIQEEYLDSAVDVDGVIYPGLEWRETARWVADYYC